MKFKNAISLSLCLIMISTVVQSAFAAHSTDNHIGTTTYSQAYVNPSKLKPAFSWNSFVSSLALRFYNFILKVKESSCLPTNKVYEASSEESLINSFDFNEFYEFNERYNEFDKPQKPPVFNILDDSVEHTSTKSYNSNDNEPLYFYSIDSSELLTLSESSANPDINTKSDTLSLITNQSDSKPADKPFANIDFKRSYNASNKLNSQISIASKDAKSNHITIHNCASSCVSNEEEPLSSNNDMSVLPSCSFTSDINTKSDEYTKTNSNNNGSGLTSFIFSESSNLSLESSEDFALIYDESSKDQIPCVYTKSLDSINLQGNEDEKNENLYQEEFSCKQDNKDILQNEKSDSTVVHLCFSY